MTLTSDAPPDVTADSVPPRSRRRFGLRRTSGANRAGRNGSERKVSGRRVPIRFVMFAVLAVAALVALAWLQSWYSPVPVRSVTVSGPTAAKQAEVLEAAAITEGTPIREIDTAAVTERVAALPGIESVDIVLQRPWTVDLQVVERIPFAVAGGPDRWVIVDTQGAVISEATARPEELPLLNSPGPDYAPAVAALRGWPEDERSAIKSVDTAADGSMTIVLKNGVPVEWGLPGQDELKAAAAVQLLQFKPKKINVSVPERPAVTGALDLPKENQPDPEDSTAE